MPAPALLAFSVRRLRRAVLPVFAVLAACLAQAAGKPAPALIHLDYADLLAIRDGIHAGDPAFQPAYRALLREADSHLSAAPDSVMNKTYTPPSGDKHDFFSIGNYSWPNPDTPDGIPYIRRDGHNNPEAKGPGYDSDRFITMRIRANALAMAWFYSRDEAYAAKAAEVLRVWFLDPATRMNPNFNYSSSLPGVYDGMSIGIIVGVELIGLLDSVKLLGLSQSWTAGDDAALQRWFRDYTTWLIESEFGREEARAHNNHCTWYDAQVAAYSLYAGDLDRARTAVARFPARLDSQMATDGSLPAELRRNRSLNYSIYGLRALVSIARSAEVLGEDIWNRELPDGRGLKKGFEFMAPYLADEKPWTWTSLDKTVNPFAIQLTRFAWKAYGTDDLARATRHLATLAPNSSRTVWLMGRTPLSP